MIEMSRIGQKVVRRRCQHCDREYDREYVTRCRTCSGLVEIEYDLSSVSFYDSDVTSQRFADLLPVESPENLLFLGEGGTPCHHAEELGASIGLDRLYLKVESTNPTGTTKDRMAAIVLSMFKDLGVREFVSSSTGNSSTALARGIGEYPEFKMHLYVGGAFRNRVRHADGNPDIIVHSLEGRNFTEAFNYARDEAKRSGLPFEGGFFNPGRREGLKLAFFEATEQVDTPIRWYFQAVSSAMGLYGTWKGAKELLALDRIPVPPRLVCVQQESCCPMVRAYEEGSLEIEERHIVHNPAGIAKAILRGDPSGCYPFVHDAVRESGGTFVAVSESEILEAKARLKEMEDLDSGYCGSATVAAVAKLAARGRIPRQDTVLLNLTD